MMHLRDFFGVLLLEQVMRQSGRRQLHIDVKHGILSFCHDCHLDMLRCGDFRCLQEN